VANPKGKILILLSSAQQLALKDGKVLPTGFYLNELGVPAKRFADEGYELVLANPKGNQPAMDASSDDDYFFGKDKERHQAIKAFVMGLSGYTAPKTLQAVLDEGLQQYCGLFVPGGHAPMADLMENKEVGQILRHFHKEGKPTAMICHGPAAALAAQANPTQFRASMVNDGDAKSQDWIYQDYDMTVFSNIEERLAELKMPAHLQFHAESALKKAGAKMHCALIPMQSKVVQDRELLTGQNPFSDEELATQFLAMLAKRGAPAARS
jgi:putative intracellular protease/amidase